MWLAAGEEANPPEFYNEVGMPMEPFNLDQEREDGFFTAGGGYVERNQADSRDAWIESLEGSCRKAVAPPPPPRGAARGAGYLLHLLCRSSGSIHKLLHVYCGTGETKR